MPIDCFASVGDFVAAYQHHRNGVGVGGHNQSEIVCIELTGASIDMHSPAALQHLCEQSLFLVVGSENQGVHSEILKVGTL